MMNEAKFDNNDFQTKAPDLLADLAKYTVMAVRECYRTRKLRKISA